MRSLLFLSLLIVAACGQKSSSGPLNYGNVSVSALIAEKGQPLKQEEISAVNGTMFIYQGNEKYQVQNDVVVASFKDPQAEQSSLMFWKHKFKECQTRLTVLPGAAGEHLPPEFEFACDKSGQKVIYTKGAEVVTRIVEYAKK